MRIFSSKSDPDTDKLKERKDVKGLIKALKSKDPMGNGYGDVLRLFK